MHFNIKNLIQVIAKKHDVDIVFDSEDKLVDLDANEIPKEFLDDFQKIVIPIVSETISLEVDTKDDLYKIIPKEFLDEVNPIDEKGNTLMSLSELYQAIDNNDIKQNSLQSNEAVDIKRQIFKSSYIHDEYPIYSGLEHSWRMLESDYKVIARKNTLLTTHFHRSRSTLS